MSNNNQEYAVHLAQMGYVIFPIEPDGKTPLLKWSTESTCNLGDIRDWWHEFPDDNIGINCGESGILVVDLDSRAALEAFDDLWREQEHADLSLFDGPIIRTRRGWHLYFDQPIGGMLHNTTAKLGEGIDTRGAGGMVVAPGSVVKGVRYEVVSGDPDAPLPMLPDWLERTLTPPPRKLDFKELQRRRKLRWPAVARAELMKYCARIVNAPDGEQNKRIYQAAFYLGLECVPPLEPDAVEDALLAAADRGNHPLYRARPTIQSGLSAGLGAAQEDAEC